MMVALVPLYVKVRGVGFILEGNPEGGDKNKSGKNLHFPLLVGFPLELSLPSTSPFAGFSL